MSTRTHGSSYPRLAKPPDSLVAADIAQLECGVALYRDDLLAGFDDPWIVSERETQRRDQLDALNRPRQFEHCRVRS